MKIRAGNSIHFLEKTSYYENEQKSTFGANILWRVVTACLVSSLIISTYVLLFEGVFFTYPITFVVLTVTVLCVIMTFISLNRKLFLGIYGVFGLIICLYTYLKWSMIKIGIHWFIERCQGLLDAYFNKYFIEEPLKESATDSFYIWCIMLLFIYISFVLLAFYKVFLAVLPSIVCIIWPFCVGYVPHRWSLLGICVSSLLLISMFYGLGRYGRVSILDARGKCLYIRKNTGILLRLALRQMCVMVVIGIMILAGALTIKYSGLEPDMETLEVQNKKLKKVLEGEIEFFESFGNGLVSTGGISKGNLASAGNLFYTGEEQLIVQTDNSLKNTLYIKGYVGDYYKENHWISDKSNAYMAFKDEIELLNLPYHHLFSGEIGHIEIKKITDFGDVDFIAYGAQSIDQNWLDDLYIDHDSNTNIYDYRPSFYNLSRDYDSLINLGLNNTAALVHAGVDAQLLAAYEDYVYERYTKLPKNSEDYIGSYYSVKPNTLSEKITWVRSFLNERCSYSLTPGYTPDGEDCVKYFLEENKVGYCMHFASSAVLLLRSMGVPTRYVEGYVLMPGSFKGTGEKQTAYVYDHQAHAWAEVYIDGFGWVPVEVTPTYYDAYALREPNVVTETESETDVVTEIENETDVDTKPESDSDVLQETLQETKQENLESQETLTGENVKDHEINVSVAPKESKLKPFLLWMVRIFLAFLGGCILLFGQYYVRTLRKQAHMKSAKRESALIFAYNDLIHLMNCNTQASIDDIVYAQKYFTYLDADQLQMLVSLCNRAAFGPGDMTEENVITGIRLYRKIRGEILKHLPKWKKCIIVLIYVL